MTTLMLWMMMASPAQTTPAQPNAQPPQDIPALVKQISESGRVLTIGEKSSDGLNPPGRLAPGKPPLLAFRYFDGRRRHRFGELDLVMDDAGH
jgi:hypothetical protein